jgi:hypothetical protein
MTEKHETVTTKNKLMSVDKSLVDYAKKRNKEEYDKVISIKSKIHERKNKEDAKLYARIISRIDHLLK